jgi:uncharacterized protein YkwD
MDEKEAAAQVVGLHNRARASRGLQALEVDPSLMEAAQNHAADMATMRRMSHRGTGATSPFDRIRRSGYLYRSAGENVAAGQVTPEEVMADWMASRGHRRNVLGNFEQIGAGYATDASGIAYWCVTFGRAGDSSLPPRGGPGVYP